MITRLLFWVCISGMLAGLLTSRNSQAQAVPMWASASTLGSGIIQNAGGCAIDAAGNKYQVGSFTGTLALGSTTLSSQGGYDGFLAKYTPTGTLAWVRQLGSAGTDITRDIALDAGGNIYITGDFAGAIALGNGVSLTGSAAPTSSSPSMCFVARYSPQGTAEWAQQSLPNASSSFGSGIGLDAAGTVYMVGLSLNSLTIGTATVIISGTGQGTFIARFSGTTGAVQSITTCFTYLPGAYYFRAPQVAVSANGDTYLLMQFTQTLEVNSTVLATRGGIDVGVAKYTPQGSLSWVQQYGGTGDESLGRGRIDAAGNLYVSGGFAGAASFGNMGLTSAWGY